MAIGLPTVDSLDNYGLQAPQPPVSLFCHLGGGFPLHLFSIPLQVEQDDRVHDY